MQDLLGSAEFEAFQKALASPAPVSIRLNPPKIPAAIPAAIQQALPVPWHPHGRYLPERPVFTLDPAFHAGAYYVQEASSMFLYEALRQSVDFSRPLKVLDLCAAPGGKSTLLSDMLSPESLLLSNEVIRTRTGALRENMEKWGAPNIAVCSAESEDFAALEGFFDVVVTDAPCSGEGLFRKDPDATAEWSPASVELCASRQRRILAPAVEALAPGGILAYSTCTYNRAENEDNVDWLLREFDLELLSLDVPAAWGITESGGGHHFYPHKVRGEGFFIAIFRKKDGVQKKQQPARDFKNIKPLSKNLVAELPQWTSGDVHFRYFTTGTGEVIALPAELEPWYAAIDKALKIKWFGTLIGEFKGRDFIPAHALALSRACSPTLPGIDLDREHALRFLKKETFDLPADAPRGWALARFSGLNLGWLKVLPGRMNNYLPAERRIRMDITGG
jgi:16S rRNA C967 or C1407 C5-methylase (RsmB/RsmF family)/NOL1/NOP2/fmu family ribosome biogenesis protein